MQRLSIPYDERVIVGMENSDDAGVYRLTEEIALIQTVDFFTPIVDDPFVFGQIAVANGLSDVYAMGGSPLTAMNIVCFPTKKFSMDVLGRILEGGLDVLKRAGVQLLGGHSVEDEELKYGVSVTGVVHPARALKNHGLREGDALVLSKALGTGIIGTAVKAAESDPAVLAPFIESMRTLNRDAAEALKGFSVHACTDITGFGLMGHLREMLAGDALEVVVDSAALPVLPGALDGAAMGLIPGGMYRNRDYVGGLCVIDATVKRELADIAFDPQTSGGLLVAIPMAEADALLAQLHSRGVSAAKRIGTVAKSDHPALRLY
jgi:selenide,water dikinase